MIYILFGPPGVGKTYIGQLVSQARKINFFDADELITENVRRKLVDGTYCQADRDEFILNLIEKVREMTRNGEDLILAEAFTKEINREKFAKMLPQSKFIFVHASYLLAKERAVERLHRKNHVITVKSIDRLWNEFDTPEIDHEILDNAGISDKELLKNFNQFIGGSQ